MKLISNRLGLAGKFLLIFIFFFFLHSLNSSLPNSPIQERASVFVGIVIKDNDQLIPFFLKSFENLDYDKQLINLQLNLCNQTQKVQDLLINWVESNKGLYNDICYINNTNLFNGCESLLDRNKIFAELKDGYLKKTKNLKSNFCFILSSDAFLLPGTLTYLIKKNEPIISPLLRPIPESNDPFRNFFFDITENGYFKEAPEYSPIANRQNLGTFKVPTINSVYLIASKYVDSLSFTKNFLDWEFLAFSKNARKKHIPQFICNEKEFGFFLHFREDKTIEEEKAFSLIGTEAEISPAIFNSILSPHFFEDPHLKEYADQFNCNDYAIYRIENRDLFYVDEGTDYIKNYIVKQGLNWEEHINEQLKKYVKPGTVALDIGGHIGMHTLSLSRIVGDRGTVHVFEPQAKLFCELVVNMSLNKCNNILFHHCALGAENKWIEIIIPEEEWTKTYGPEIINEGHGTITDVQENVTGDRARMIRLDDLQLNDVSLIKIDVEGFENEVIKGGKETILRNKPVMIVEIFPSPEKVKKIKEIEDLGYMHSHLYMDDYLFIPKHMVELPTHIKSTHSNNETSFDSSKFKSIETPKTPIEVVWEGSFLDLGSLSHVNRCMINQLAKLNEIILNCIPTDLLKNSTGSYQTPFKNTKVTVRHSWPPNWEEPPTGKWVLIQPWEFGSIPEEWVEKTQKVDEIWVPSHFVKSEYIASGVPAEKVFVVPNGFDPTKFNRDVEPFKLDTNKKFKFLYVGGTIHRKGSDILLRSYQQCFNANDDVCLIVKDFGNSSWYAGQTNDNLFKAAQGLPDAAEIIYLDHEMSQADLARLYRACDCLVSPYRGEGFCLPVLEAMACGLPVIVTAGGATDDFVTNEFGWFIPSKITSIGPFLKDIKLAKDGWLLEPDAQILSTLLLWVKNHPSEAYAKGLVASKYMKQHWTWESAAKIAVKRLENLK